MQNKNQSVISLYITLLSKYLISLGCVEIHQSVSTKSRYYKYNDLKFRISDHISSTCSTDYNVIIDSIHPSSYFLCCVNRRPMVMNSLRDVKQSIYNYIVLQDSLICMDTAKTDIEIQRYKAQIKDLKDSNSKVKDNLNEVSMQKFGLIKKNKKIKTKLVETKQQYDELKNQHEELRKQCDELNKRCEELDNKCKQQIPKHEELRKRCETLDNDYEKLKTAFLQCFNQLNTKQELDNAI